MCLVVSDTSASPINYFYRSVGPDYILYNFYCSVNTPLNTQFSKIKFLLILFYSHYIFINDKNLQFFCQFLQSLHINTCGGLYIVSDINQINT